MEFLATGVLTTRKWKLAAIALALVLGITLVVSPTSSASAASGKSTYVHSNTTTTDQVALALGINSHSGRTPTANRIPASDVYHVSKSFVEKKQAQCRRLFGRHRHKRHVCVVAQEARAMQTKYFVTHARIQNLWNLYKLDKRLAKKCRHHHTRCAHNPRYRHLTVRTCGPLAYPRWHFVATCLSLRSSRAYGRWVNLQYFRAHSLPATASAQLRLANATYGVKDTSHTVVLKDWDWFGGTNTIIKFSRSATVKAYHQIWVADTALAAANGLCVAAGVAGKSSQLALACSVLASATIGKEKNDLTNAYNEGKCLQLKYYDIYAIGPVPNIRNAFPSSVTDCVSSKMARRR